MPLCCPLRGSLLTSLYPHKAVPGHEMRLDPELPLVSDVYSENGYDTAYFGKWHLEGLRNAEDTCSSYVIPRERRGRFQTWIGYENNNSPFHTWVHGHNKKGDEIAPFPLQGYETDEMTNLFISYIKNREKAETPFFAVLSVQPPHDPHFAPSVFMERHTPGTVCLRENVPSIDRIEERARRHSAGYYAQIENLDYNLGKILDMIEKTGQADRTHIIFFSDHGEMMGSHGQFRKMSPYEEAVRIPVILSGGRSTALKRGLKGGYCESVCFNHVDFAPTSLGLCGIAVPEWMEGQDMSWMRIEGKSRAEETRRQLYDLLARWVRETQDCFALPERP